MHRFARALELTAAHIGIGTLLLLIVVANNPSISLAQTSSNTSSACSAPSFYSLSVTPAYINVPWNLPLLSTIEGQYTPTVSATGLPPGIQLQDQKVTLTAGGGTLHNWVLTGAPSQLGTYTITVVAQNSCGGASTVVTLPINNAVSSLGQVCPNGTTGTYPNCSPVVAATSTPVVTTPAPTSTPVSAVVAPKQALACPAISGVLQFGSRGNSVVSLQNFLIQTGYLAPGNASGYFGSLTKAAVRQFQARAGIASSGSETTTGFGLVGARTRAAMMAGCAGGTSTAGTSAMLNQVQPVTSLPNCPSIPVPPCQGGKLISKGADQDHCSLGYVCINTPQCPPIGMPTCTHGIAVSLGTDANGCTVGYQCQQVSCPFVQVITSCPAGQTLVSGTDQYGCPSISYCK